MVGDTVRRYIVNEGAAATVALLLAANGGEVNQRDRADGLLHTLLNEVFAHPSVNDGAPVVVEQVAKGTKGISVETE